MNISFRKKVSSLGVKSCFLGPTASISSHRNETINKSYFHLLNSYCALLVHLISLCLHSPSKRLMGVFCGTGTGLGVINGGWWWVEVPTTIPCLLKYSRVSVLTSVFTLLLRERKMKPRRGTYTQNERIKPNK